MRHKALDLTRLQKHHGARVTRPAPHGLLTGVPLAMTHKLDARGLNCPLPVLKARRAIKSVPVGDCLTVLATDPAAYIDFRHFCDTSGHELAAWSEDGGVFTFVIRKAG